jgi:GNAT superfamily N-acetyltransferase
MNIALTEFEINSCYIPMKELRPNLIETDFVQTIRDMQNEGYILSYLEVNKIVVCVAGFRIYSTLAVEGNALYIYDLVTLEAARSKKYGEQMLLDLKGYAKESKCNVIHLDSHVKRNAAHRFYLKNRFDIIAHHFWMET